MANLKVELRESIKLSENLYDSYTKTTITGINEVSKRVVTVPTTESELIAMASASIGAGTFAEKDVRYIRITNQSQDFPLLLTLKNENNNEFIYKLDKECSFIYTGERDFTGKGIHYSGSGVINSLDASDNVITGVDSSYENLGDLVNITAMASGSTDRIASGSAGSGSKVQCNVELFVASI